MNEGTTKSLLVDSNLLLLLLVGSLDLRLIPSFKRVSAFSSADFQLLREFSSSRVLITTPHVLTEVSNLANALPANVKKPFMIYFASIASAFAERFTPLFELGTQSPFALFGLTDAAVCDLAESAIVLTEDMRLRSYLIAQGKRALSLADVRALRNRTNAQVN